MAGVLARPPVAPYDTLLLAGGTDTGVRAGMEALGDAGIPVGFVSAAGASYARVTLLSSSGVATDAWIGPSRVPVTLKGAGGGAFTASASRSASIAPGDIVYLSGAGAVPFGLIVRVAGASSDPVATLSVRPYVNPLTLTSVILAESATLASTTLVSGTAP